MRFCDFSNIFTQEHQDQSTEIRVQIGNYLQTRVDS